MAFAYLGRQLTFGWTLALGRHVGFDHGTGLLRFAALCNGESLRYTEAWYENLRPTGEVDDNGEPIMFVHSIDRGLTMVNSQHDAQLPPSEAFQPIPNAQFAWQLSEHGRDFTPWYAYKNRSVGYTEGLKWAAYYYEHGTGWRKRIDRVEQELG